MRLLLASVGTALVVSSVAAGDVATPGARWPGPTVSVWNATSYGAASQSAIRAWNDAGARIRFVRAASRSAADVVIVYGKLRQQGRADLGYRPNGSTVWVARGLGRRGAAIIMSHELGHVLGLRHAYRRCALMEPVVELGAGSFCGTAACRELWRCLVQPDDRARLVALYGRAPSS